MVTGLLSPGVISSSSKRSNVSGVGLLLVFVTLWLLWTLPLLVRISMFTAPAAFLLAVIGQLFAA